MYHDFTKKDKEEKEEQEAPKESKPTEAIMGDDFEVSNFAPLKDRGQRQLFMNTSNSNIFVRGGNEESGIIPLEGMHAPFFYVWGGIKVKKKIEMLISTNRQEGGRNFLINKIVALSDFEELQSFNNFDDYRRVFRVYTQRPRDVPDVSNYLFLYHGINTYEHDIPYRDRVIADFMNDKDEPMFLWDTKGEWREIDVLCYDIENPTGMMDIIGWAWFKASIKTTIDFKSEKFEYDIKMHSEWDEPPIEQLIAYDVYTEARNIAKFIKVCMEADVIAGHNVVIYDNKQLYDRIKRLMNLGKFEDDELKVIKTFLKYFCEPKKCFFQGRMKDGCNFYPTTFDTYHASVQFMRNEPKHSLKYLAKRLGFIIEDRKYMDDWKSAVVNDFMIVYNEHDVREQLGLTMYYLKNGILLSMLFGMPLEECMASMTTKQWDFATLTRCVRDRKIYPPMVCAARIAEKIEKLCRIPHIVDPWTKQIKKPGNEGELMEYSYVVERIKHIYLTMLSYEREKIERAAMALYNKYGSSIFDTEVENYLTNVLGIKKDTDENRKRDFYRTSILRKLQNYEKFGFNGTKSTLYAKRMWEQYNKRFNEATSFGVDGTWLKKLLGEFSTDWMRDVLRMIKYGDEMNWYVRYPEIVRDYYFPGGFTIKPTEVDSEFKMWYDIVVMDVGAMYPNNLLAKGVGGETVRHLWKWESDGDVQDWVWVKHMPDALLKHIKWREPRITEDEIYAHNNGIFKRIKPGKSTKEMVKWETHPHGVMVGVKFDGNHSCVGNGLLGVMDFISKIKSRKESLEELVKQDAKYEDELDTVNAVYKSLKGLRNSGTHGIICCPTVTNRQYNPWGGSVITTTGQIQLTYAMKKIKEVGGRIVYGDTDGIYTSCSKTAFFDIERPMKNEYRLYECMKLDGMSHDEMVENAREHVITDPQLIYDVIEGVNTYWRELLSYNEFTFEPERHAGMIFRKHKNYIIFDTGKTKDGKPKLKVKYKGNSFDAKDKPQYCKDLLNKALMKALERHIFWENEKLEESNLKADINHECALVYEDFDPTKLEQRDLEIVQSVKPVAEYSNPDTPFAQRALAYEKLLRATIDETFLLVGSESDTFIVCVEHLPDYVDLSVGAKQKRKKKRDTHQINTDWSQWGCGDCNLDDVIEDESDMAPSKSDSKPLPYMIPVQVMDAVPDRFHADYDWYKFRFFAHIKGAFGFDDVSRREKTIVDIGKDLGIWDESIFTLNEDDVEYTTEPEFDENKWKKTKLVQFVDE